MKDQPLCKPKIEALVLDEPIDGWLFVVPVVEVKGQQDDERKQPKRWHRLRNMSADKIESLAKVVRGH